MIRLSLPTGLYTNWIECHGSAIGRTPQTLNTLNTVTRGSTPPSISQNWYIRFWKCTLMMIADIHHWDRYHSNQRLQKIFDQLTDHNITLGPVARNVSSRRSQVEYVGQVINQYLSPFSKAKLDKVDTFEKPDTIKKLKRFYALLRTFGIIESSWCVHSSCLATLWRDHWLQRNH